MNFNISNTSKLVISSAIAFAFGAGVSQLTNGLTSSSKDEELSYGKRERAALGNDERMSSATDKRVRAPKAGELLTRWQDLGKMKSIPAYRVAMFHLFESLDASEMPAFFEEMSQLRDPLERDDALEQLFHHWGTKDPMAAFEFLKLQGNQKFVSETLPTIFAAWAETAPADALAAADQLPPGPGRDNVLLSVIEKWVKDDPNAVAAHALKLPAGSSQTEALICVAEELSSADASTIQSFIASIPNQAAKSKVMLSFANSLSSSAPDKAMDIVLQMSPGEDQEEALHDVFGDWGGTDPHAAFEYADSLDPVFKSKAMETILTNWISEDPHASFEYVVKSTGLEQRSNMLEMIASQLGSINPQQAKEQAQRLSGPEKDQFLKRVYTVWAQSDPAAAVLAAETQLNGSAQLEVFSQSASQWAQKDPVASTRWADSLPDEKKRRVVPYMLFSWGKSDPTAAANYIKSIKPGELRDSGVAAYAAGLFQSNPDSALDWSVSIADQKTREGSIQQLFPHWYRSSPQVAQSWLNRSNLNPDFKSAIQARMNSSYAQ
jgi:hypothetical protein